MIPVKSVTKTIRIDKVSTRIFRRKYFVRCLDCPLCQDMCCWYGCDIDIGERDRILTYAQDLEAAVGVPASGWFEEQTKQNPDYPSGRYTRSKVYHQRCVFYDHTLRGCYLHRFAIEKGMDPHFLKPMVCFLFPLTWHRDCLSVSRFLNELPCKNQGLSIFSAQKNELAYYLGDDFVSELQINMPKQRPDPPALVVGEDNRLSFPQDDSNLVQEQELASALRHPFFRTQK